MAVTNGMFIFEVVIDTVQSFVDSRCLVIKSDFADIFSLELKDPKQMHIVMPEPPPLPPEPPGKKGKKKKPPKPKKGKKKGKVEEPPPEPCIQAGQSVLFSSSAEFLIQSMKQYPLEVSLWSKEDSLVFIGSNTFPWDPVFICYLDKIANGEAPPSITIKDEYNIFEEGTAKKMAKIGLQVKLSFLGDKVTTAFRTLSEDPTVKKVLYTGINSKTTSYMCTMKTTDEDFIENSNKVANSFIVDKPKQNKIMYADYKNAPGANLTFFNDGDYCCMGHADKPPESIYKAPETCPDIDFIIDYVRKIIVSCNDNMRMLTPRPTISPRVKATDMDRYCYCKESTWPQGKFAERFKKEVQSRPCPICIDAGKKPEGSLGATFDIANIRGPCGKADCRIARDLRAYIENLIEEDNAEFNLQDIVGPCGSQNCTLAQKIQEFLRHEGIFREGGTVEGLSTQCACVEKMMRALASPSSCESACSKECADDVSNDTTNCDGPTCPFSETKVYNVYYFTVEVDKQSGTSSPPHTDTTSSYRFCSTDCPSFKTTDNSQCSKSACSTLADRNRSEDDRSQVPNYPEKGIKFIPSPADSNIMINFEDIRNSCCVKSCDMATKVKDFIVDGVMGKAKKTTEKKDSCYCDCECSVKFTKNTTYCAVCGGYECLGDDTHAQPDYAKPHPCPVFHNLYDKRYIKTPNPWPDHEAPKPQQADAGSTKSSKAGVSKQSDRRLTATRSKNFDGKKPENKEPGAKKAKKETKKVGKFTVNVEQKAPPQTLVVRRPETKYPYPPVPKNMGWNWNAEDIPGMKPRPKWKPGAANKILVRRYRAMREGMDVIAKKKRAMLQKKKKIEMRPTLVVAKKNGEYTVQMEVFRKYSKERLPFQFPYDEKPPLVYTIGKTAEEKQKIKIKHERKERREIRRKSRYIQSSFRDKCQEICLKAYNQAIGVLPLPNPNDPNCPCTTETDPNMPSPIDSCSCSDEESISTSDTDGDEWVIEFSPPVARFDPKAKHPPVITENETQYSYLDYKVKVLDKSGNQVPRFFKGPDGKQECSDLGGFWGPGHVWMEINKDGYIGPDNRWIPMNFIGPDGMFYSAEEGFFTDSSGQMLKLGIDGYIDKDGKWVRYSKKTRGGGTRSPKSNITKSTADDERAVKAVKSDTRAKPKSATPDTKDNKSVPRNNKHNKLNKTVSYRTARLQRPIVMSVSMNYDRKKLPRLTQNDRLRGNTKKIAKYREIMQGLQMYEDFYDLRPLMKANRASNTPYKYGSSKTIGNAKSVKQPTIQSIELKASTSYSTSVSGSQLMK